MTDSQRTEYKGFFPKAIMEDDQLIFTSQSDYDFALSQGVFFLKIPESVNPHAGILFCENFYKEKDNTENDDHKGFKTLSYNDSILGYSDRHDQVEQVQLELSLWKEYFTKELASLLESMNHLGLQVVQNIFSRMGIPLKYWDVITGGASKNQALQYCIFNHYRSEINNIGITKHKDSGFITILYSPEPGLEAYSEGKWIPINPEPGYFTINLGHSFEVLTSKLSKPVFAVEHRVRQIIKPTGIPDRYSFGTYLGPRFDMHLYQYEAGDLMFYQTFLEFQQIKARQMGYEFHPKVKVS